MATTEQRPAFRLPWSTDSRSSTPTSDEASPAPDATPDAENVPTEVPSAAEATPMTDATETLDPRTAPWPDKDRTSGPEVAASASARRPADEASATPRKSNPLVAGLVRAMRDAAAAARDDAAVRFTDEAKARIEAIHAASADEAAGLRSRAEGDVVGVREWSKAEMARVREETEQRIAARKNRLELELESHTARVERRIERVHGAVGTFEQQMDAFFEQLFAEEDPARLAGMAEQLPDAPSLEIDDAEEDFAAGPTSLLDAEGAAAAEAEAFADLDPSLEGDLDDDVPDAGDPEYDSGDVALRLEAFTGPSAARGAATTTLSVTGLVSVASIAGFKRAVGKLSGVRSVAVSSGPTGDFVFTVSHTPDADLASAIPSLDGFSAAITGDADSVLTVTASDPAGDR
ncbi:MAG: hypothetical protein ABIV26_01700 [Candidatus Limnocylindrales bacterium]